MKRRTCIRCKGSGHEPDWVSFGAVARKRRTGLKLSLKALAERCVISEQYLSDLERGRRTWQGELARRVLSVLDRLEAVYAR